jgi:hypothetical protein
VKISFWFVHDESICIGGPGDVGAKLAPDLESESRPVQLAGLPMLTAIHEELRPIIGEDELRWFDFHTGP